jgi:predicted transcriptional regulator
MWWRAAPAVPTCVSATWRAYASATVREDDDSETAIAVMQESGVRRLLVTDADRHLSSIVAFDNLMVTCARTMQRLIDRKTPGCRA